MAQIECSIRCIEVSREEPLCNQVRRRWDEIFAPTLENLQPNQIRILPTGIGGAPAINQKIATRRFPDTSKIPSYIDLKEEFGEVPRVLTLIASPVLAEDLVSLLAVAREYKNQGVEKIIAQITSLAHERQDHKFFGKDGKKLIKEVVTLDAIMGAFASPYLRKDEDGKNVVIEPTIDAGMAVQNHSKDVIEKALEYGIPLLSIDAFDYLAQEAHIENQKNVFILGPDNGRRKFGKKMAEKFDFPFGCATKKRKREANGEPEIEISMEDLIRIKNTGEQGARVVIFDDEIREAGTIGAIAKVLEGYASEIIVYATKGIFAGNAIANLISPLISRIYITDAVLPMQDITDLRDKITWIPLQLGLDSLNSYLQQHLSEPDNDDWLSPEVTGTTLHLHEE